MAEQSGFFDAHLVDGEYDRVYLAEHFAKYFASFIGNGIFGGKSNELMVRAKETASMGVRVLSGQAWIDGYWYENDDECPLTIDIADGVLHRIDSIVVRWTYSERVIRLAVKKGVAATNPIAPTVQRDDDYYELKLADISISAGTTQITQSNIIDKRLNTDECGLVIGVVQQLDADEFGIQLEAYISEFIAEHNAWKDATQTDVNTWITNFKNTNSAWFDQFKVDSNSAVDAFLSENQEKVNKLISDGRSEINALIADNEAKFNQKITEFDNVISDGQTEIDRLVAELEETLSESDVTILNAKIVDVVNRVVTLESDVATLKTDVTGLKNNVTTIYNSVSALSRLFIESGQYPGCFYRMINNNTEWINPPTAPGFEYLTTERWNNNPVYQRTIYVGSLPNKTVMSISVGSTFDKIISISGFAIDSDNNMHYPFPIILNGLTPAAVIQGAEGDGGSGSGILIQTNEDISSFIGYITVKYTKS